MKTKSNKFNAFLIKLLTIVTFVSIAYLANLFVTEWFGGVNPFIEFSSTGFSKIESEDSRHRAGLETAFNACKNTLNNTRGSYEFLDESYQAWDLSNGRFMIQSKIYRSTDTGSSMPAKLICRILKTEDENFLITKWEIQGVQVSLM